MDTVAYNGMPCEWRNTMPIRRMSTWEWLELGLAAALALIVLLGPLRAPRHVVSWLGIVGALSLSGIAPLGCRLIVRRATSGGERLPAAIVLWGTHGTVSALALVAPIRIESRQLSSMQGFRN